MPTNCNWLIRKYGTSFAAISPAAPARASRSRVIVLVCRSKAITLDSGIMMKNIPKISQAGTLCCTALGLATAPLPALR